MTAQSRNIAHKAFFARFDVTTSSTAISYEALVGTRDGKLFRLSTRQPHQIATIRKRPIAQPRIASKNGHNQIQ